MRNSTKLDIGFVINIDSLVLNMVYHWPVINMQILENCVEASHVYLGFHISILIYNINIILYIIDIREYILIYCLLNYYLANNFILFNTFAS